MSLTEISIKRPILIIVFFIVVALLGIFAVKQLKYELLPKINAPIITISAIYTGASPAEIENTLTKKIEDAIAGVSKVKRISSRSNEGYAVITIEFVQDTDLDKSMQEVQRYVNQILPDLPKDAKTPIIDKYSLADLPILRIASTAKMNENDFFELLKNQIKPQLSQIKGVGRIQLIGGQEKELKIFLDENKLKQYKISILSVMQALQKANVEIPIGDIKDKDAQFGLRLRGKFGEISALENLDILKMNDESKIKLKDIAQIIFGNRETTTLTRLNQKSAIGIVIQKQSDANAVEVSEKVHLALHNLESEYKNGNLHFEVASDSSEFTLKATETVFHDLLIAIVLVALVMLVFLHSLRNAVIVMIAIPASLIFSFLGMFIMGFSLNLMTLLAMSLVIGILVDDSIVVLENIYRHLEMGKDKVKASLEGRNEIAFSALSITLVDVVVFLPLAFVPGITGGLVKEFALVIVVSTLASLLVCFTLTPMLASRFAKLEHLSNKTLFGFIILRIEKQIQNLTLAYVYLLKKSLKYRFIVYILAFGSLIASFELVSRGYIGGEFVPATDKGEISVTVEMPAGTKLQETNEVSAFLEQKIAKLPEVKRIFNTIGLANDPIFGELTTSNVMEFSILLTDKEKRTKSILQVSQQIKNLCLQEAGLKVKVSPIGLIGAEATPIQILINGTDRQKMLEYAKKLKKHTQNLQGTDDVILSVTSGKPELDIDINRERLATLGLQLEEVMMALRVAMTGFEDLKFKDKNTEIGVRVQLQKIDRENTENLENLSFLNAKGEIIYLKQIAKITRTSAETALERRNKNASVILFSKAIGKSVNEIGQEIKDFVDKNPPAQGIKISYEGDLELADDSFLYLGLAILAGIVFIYLIMVALYNSFLYPFVVLFSIPVALTGALLALALMMKTLNVFSIFGMIMMLGLVAKNAILIVDKTNELKNEGRNVLYALLNAGTTRLRPILMTTLAMVIGMMPLALQKGSGGEYNSALAWVLIGGLTSSMIFTVFLVPAIYLELEKIMAFFANISFFKQKNEDERNKNQENKTKENKNQEIKITEKIIITTFILFLINVNAFSQIKLALKDVSEKILLENAEIKIAQQEVLRTKIAQQEAWGNYLPTFNFSGSFNHNIKPLVFFLPANVFDPSADAGTFNAIPASAKNAYQAGFNLSVPLLQFENKPLLALAKNHHKIASLNVSAKAQQKTSEVQKFYYQALFALAQVHFIEENIARQQKNLAEIRQKLSQGLAINLDTLNVFVQSENLKPQHLKAKNAYKLAENNLKLQLNIPKEEQILLVDSLVFGEMIENPILKKENTYFFKINPEKRPDLIQIQAQKQSILFGKQAEKGRLMPNLQAIGQFSALTQSENFNLRKYHWVNTAMLGLQLNIPLFNGFRVKNRLAQMDIQATQTQMQYDYALAQSQLEAETYQTQIQETITQIKTQNYVVESAQKSYNLTLDRWKQGLLKQNELYDVELALQQAKFNRLELVYQYFILQIDVKRVFGDGF